MTIETVTGFLERPLTKIIAVGSIFFLFLFMSYCDLPPRISDAIKPQYIAQTHTESLQSSFPTLIDNLPLIGIEANTYDPGNCTWFVKDKRPELSSSLGNANTWFERAKQLGYKTGLEPRVNAVATTDRGYYGHVALVREIRGGQVLLEEMNVLGNGVVDSMWYNSSDYRYIY